MQALAHVARKGADSVCCLSAVDVGCPPRTRRLLAESELQGSDGKEISHFTSDLPKNLCWRRCRGYLFRDQFLGDGNPSSTAIDLIRGQRLPIPDLLTGTEIDGKRVYDLTMRHGFMTYVPGKETATYGYNGDILGPTLLMQKGDDVVINVTNQLGEPTTTHWHGLHLPAVMDGGPHQEIGHGETWHAQYTIMNEEATFWYHPHLEGKTAEHVYAGLAGLLIVKDPQIQYALPDQYGTDDIPLVVQDRIIDADGSFNYPGTEFGVKGDQILVNGAITPVFDAPAQLVRLRLLNGSQCAFLQFWF